MLLFPSISTKTQYYLFFCFSLFLSKSINQLGLKPDMIILRSEEQIDSGPVKKVAMYGDLEESCVFNIPNKSSLFEVPLLLH